MTTDSTHNNPVFENILNRDFTTTALNQKWAGDITYVPTDEGWLYLAIIIDIHSRSVVGWSMSKRMKKDLEGYYNATRMYSAIDYKAPSKVELVA